MPRKREGGTASLSSMPTTTRGYQQEMLEESLKSNIIIALDTGAGKTHIAVLRIKIEAEREPTKVSWFLAPTVALCEQQRSVIQNSLPLSVGLISGSNVPEQWKDPALWPKVLAVHRVVVSTPQVLLDALRHGYVSLGRDISLLVFDEAHHAVDNHPYNRIMQEFYTYLPARTLQNAVSGLVRPSVLGLTASPIYGGDVERAFDTIESNLQSVIRSALNTRIELAQYVHRPVFKHVMYEAPSASHPPFSTNLAALLAVINTLSIHDDPYVCDLRAKLARTTPGTPDHARLDQKLSQTVLKSNSFTHKGLRDFANAAEAILQNLGVWAADWYVYSVIQHALRAASPGQPNSHVVLNWRDSEKAYLISILSRVPLCEPSDYPEDIESEASDKVRALIDILLTEKLDSEDVNESYSGIIFVQRRDVVIALAELLRHHPFTADAFHLGCLLGSSENAYRHSFLDITRGLLNQTQEETLRDFRIGELDVLVATAVAEEGLDIQACGSVIRWDPPQNMASWAQSRGRARKKRSTFTLMFDNTGKDREAVEKWEEQERAMVRLYNDPARAARVQEEAEEELFESDAEKWVFEVPETGALLTLHSAVSHLSHFCAVIPRSAHADNRPLYDLDPPDLPLGWHSEPQRPIEPYTGPWASTVTLPRALPLPSREFTTEQVYKTKISAHRHAAFMAYKMLYDAGLLNEHLLPITSIVEPPLDEEVKAMLKDVERREGMASVALQMDPWAPPVGAVEEVWWEYELGIEGLPPLRMFNQSKKIELQVNERPMLYRPGKQSGKLTWRFVGIVRGDDGGKEERIARAREYTRMIFWSLNGSRMVWEKLNFSYLFLPADVDAPAADEVWSTRRAWLVERNVERGFVNKHRDAFLAPAAEFGERFGYPTDIDVVRCGFSFGKAFRFVRWRYGDDPLTEEEEAAFRKLYSRFEDLEVVYPLLVVEPLPARVNFLVPIPATPPGKSTPVRPQINLLAQASAVLLLSAVDVERSFLLPSVLRSLSMTLTVASMRDMLFSASPALRGIPDGLLMTAMTAPMAQERQNYQRLETLGDTVMKFVVGMQLLGEYPLWHEGYLTKKKDHAVSNGRLAKEDITRGMFRWIIRDVMVGRKWVPRYFSENDSQPPLPTSPAPPQEDEEASSTHHSGEDTEGKEKTHDKKKSKQQDSLSTKVLADVVESTIGAAYLHGGFDLGYECVKFFDLGLKWQPLRTRIDALLSRIVENPQDIQIPPQLSDVEHMIGYTFRRKLLLIEALTHASYEQNLHTPSYERMEFLGDSVLDMAVTDFLYRAPGKNYSPGHMHLRKSAVVNAHFLAYICLRCFTDVDASMPSPSEIDGRIKVQKQTHRVYLWQCLLHSSSRILEDQMNTNARYERMSAEIEEALQKGIAFPWAALTRMQAPKFFSDMVESLVGAVYLDSGGSMHLALRVLRILGIMGFLERIVKDGVDVRHPVSRLEEWRSKNDKELEYVFKKEHGNVSCTLIVNGVEEVTSTAPYRGQVSQEEVRFVVAEKAIKMFKLRDGDESWKELKGKRRPQPKKKKDKKGKGKEVMRSQL